MVLDSVLLVAHPDAIRLRPESQMDDSQTFLSVHIQPRAKRTEVVGWHGNAIKIRISSPPVDGAANDELVRFVAELAGVPRASVQIVSGTASRRKRLVVRGVAASFLLSALGLGAD
jgi:uncharacterized protein (TIGR00251 family)